jgi:hypothetical protein
MKKITIFIILTIITLTLNAQVIEDFEMIDLNPIIGGSDDLSNFSVVDNPNPNVVNSSSAVAKYMRDKNGLPEGGFWSILTNPIDLTANKYIHVKVLKPRISPVKFRFEGGSSGDMEVESINPQTKINEWEELVFDFSALTGTYNKIVFMPDYEFPLSLLEDIDIYLDDIVLNNEPSVRPMVTFNVDMSDSIASGWFNETTDQVWLAGSMNNWEMPGIDLSFNMTESADDNIYSLTYPIASGDYNYKYFKIINWIPTWDFYEWNVNLGPDRSLTVAEEDLVLNDVFGQLPEKSKKSYTKSIADCIIEDFEIISLNVILGNQDDQSTMTVVPNPDQSGINNSRMVVKYIRDKDGIPGGGFMSNIYRVLDEPDQYFHVKVLKPRISPVKLGIGINNYDYFEIFSMNVQSYVGEWEDMVFGYGQFWTLTQITFMPDYEDPLTLTEDITIYFDDIIVNNDPNPFTNGTDDLTVKQTVKVFPNPADNFITIHSILPVKTVSVSTISGQEIIRYDHICPSGQSFDISKLTPGFYFLTVYYTSGEYETLKIIKE